MRDESLALFMIGQQLYEWRLSVTHMAHQIPRAEGAFVAEQAGASCDIKREVTHDSPTSLQSGLQTRLQTDAWKCTGRKRVTAIHYRYRLQIGQRDFLHVRHLALMWISALKIASCE